MDISLLAPHGLFHVPPLLDMVNMEPLQGNKRTTLVTTITAVLIIGLASATIADAQPLPMMGGTPAAQPGGGYTSSYQTSLKTSYVW